MGYLNPLFKLPAAQDLLSLGAPEKAALGRLMMDLRRQANDEAEMAWKRRKGPMACYWRAVSTYARHVAHVMRGGHVAAPGATKWSPEVARLQNDLDVARRQVAALVDAASVALPGPSHPRTSTPENWARQLRNLGQPESAAQLWLPLCAEPLDVSGCKGGLARAEDGVYDPA